MGKYCRGRIFSREDIFARGYFSEKIFSREDIFPGRYFRVNSIFAKISSRENISNSLFAKFSSRENKVLYSTSKGISMTTCCLYGQILGPVAKAVNVCQLEEILQRRTIVAVTVMVNT